MTNTVTYGVSHAAPTRPDPYRDVSAPNLPLLLATSHTDVRAARIAAEAVRQLDELSLIGYPILSLEQRAVYGETIRHVAEGVIDS